MNKGLHALDGLFKKSKEGLPNVYHPMFARCGVRVVHARAS